jgi:hypothetical protein
LFAVSPVRRDFYALANASKENFNRRNSNVGYPPACCCNPCHAGICLAWCRGKHELGVPGFYFQVGGTPQAALDAAAKGALAVAGHHSGLFKVDARASIVTGATAMTVAVMELLGKR